MTPYEFACYAEGRGESSRDDVRKLAWATAAIMSCWTKEPVSPARLLGERVDLSTMSQEQIEEHYARKRKKARR